MLDSSGGHTAAKWTARKEYEDPGVRLGKLVDILVYLGADPKVSGTSTRVSAARIEQQLAEDLASRYGMTLAAAAGHYVYRIERESP